MGAKKRIERDSLGEVAVPRQVLWGAETQRALDHFSNPWNPALHPLFLTALFYIKKAACSVNGRLGAIPPVIAEGIAAAVDEALAGKLSRHFAVPAINSGAGTSAHMNVNEVLARRATQILYKKGALPLASSNPKKKISRVDAHGHVNFGQSTNDVVPSAIRIASLLAAGELEQEVAITIEECRRLGDRFTGVKVGGLTHLRDALPVTVGRRFYSFSSHFEIAMYQLRAQCEIMRFLPLGGSAVGTGANTVPGYRLAVIQELSWLLLGRTGRYGLFESFFAGGMNDTASYLGFMGALKSIAIQTQNLCLNLELASSGPSCGLGLLELPVVLPGSSIMPGKVNPTIAEHVDQQCARVVGNDAMVSALAQRTQFELNTRMPAIAHGILESASVLTCALRLLRTTCLSGIAVNEDRCVASYENTAAWVTLLAPSIGYHKAAELVPKILEAAKRDEKSVLAVIAELELSTQDGKKLDRAALESLAFPEQS